jgi:hypothetical protein
MASFTPRMALKRNDGSDPFSRQDFVDNWNKIDAAPGKHICTSTSRPTTWGAAHAGREIIETDTGRTLTWNGTGWQEPRVATGTHIATITPSVYLNANTTGTYTLATVSILRPCMFSLTAVFRLSTRPSLYTQAFCDILIDDVVRTRGGTGNTSWADQQATATQYDDKDLVTFAETTLQPGNHTIKGRVRVGNVSSNNVFVAYISTFGLVGQGAAGASVYL